jgi:hypothetical protein
MQVKSLNDEMYRPGEEGHPSFLILNKKYLKKVGLARVEHFYGKWNIVLDHKKAMKIWEQLLGKVTEANDHRGRLIYKTAYGPTGVEI